MVAKAAVIGYPIHHSLSPRIHTYWLKECGLSGSYDRIAVAPEELETFLLERLIKEEFAGVNVTIPHKERAYALIGSDDPYVNFLGTINTVIVENREGKATLTATNTDGIGFTKNLEHYAPDFPYIQGKAVVLGAGGAAKPIIYALLENFNVPELVLINRTRDKCEAIKERAMQLYNGTECLGKRIIIIDWEERHQALRDAQMVVNTTALGMVGQPPLELDLGLLPRHALVTDIIYNPRMTGLLQQAQARGNLIVEGIGMLLHQAAPGFRAWFDPQGTLPAGAPLVTDALRDYVIQGLHTC